jgi:hypothetical protein
MSVTSQPSLSVAPVNVTVPPDPAGAPGGGNVTVFVPFDPLEKHVAVRLPPKLEALSVKVPLSL